ncbi:MAG: hypothetical protein GXO73_01685 [Calditrichaeota bacterium]|nr:hypothetical protein [Calditrichota bacterium]
MRICALVAATLLRALASAGPQPAGQQAAEPSTNLTLLRNVSSYERQFTVVLGPADSVVALPDSFILAGSVRLYAEGQPVPDSCYAVSLRHRLIRLLHHLPSDSLQIRYEILPLQIPWRWRGLPFRRYVELLTAGGPPAPASKRRSPLWSPQKGLRQSGSVVRGINFGTDRGLTLQSGLRLQLSGKVADKINVTASLTDQNTPLQPEGNTQTLQEIDKVFVQIDAPGVKATLGDFELDFPGQEFERYHRKLQGGMVRLQGGGLEGILSGAASRGRFTTNRFMGQEGVQGPYRLHSEDGRTDIIVLAGTERVWVDGVRMVRGEDHDYVIDYSTGEITFTRHRLITADSRIEVDFQYSDEQFRRSLYAIRLGNRREQGRLHWRTTYVRESDDTKNPVGFVLNERRLAALRRAGDDPTKATVDGAEYVGEGKGSYVYRDSVFVYVGPGKGDYRVHFSDVGEGHGDYRYRGVGIFEYVGPGRGRYLPVIRLPLAQREEQMVSAAEVNLGGTGRVQAQWAVSRFDRNLYSSLDDADNLGAAGVVTASVHPKLGRFGDVAWHGLFRRVGPRFHDIDRTQQVEYNRRWDLPDQASREETVLETGGELNLAWGLASRLSVGRLAKPGGFRSSRSEALVTLDRRGWPTLNLRQVWIDRSAGPGSSGSWVRRRGDLRYRRAWLSPYVQYEAERRRETAADTLTDAFQFDRWRVGAEFLRGRRLSLGWYSERRVDDRLRRGLVQPFSVATTHNFRGELKGGRDFSVRLDLTHRERRYEDGLTPNARTDLADLAVRWSPLRRAIQATWHYQVSNTQVARQERVFLKVEPGRGNYRFDPAYNEYVPDPYGDTILRLVTTDEYLPVVDLRTGAVVRTNLGRLFPTKRRGRLWWRLIRQLSTESTLRLEEKTQYPHPGQIYLLHTSVFRDPRYTLVGVWFGQHDVYYRRGRRDGSVRLRWRHREGLNNRLLEGGQSSLDDLRSLMVQLSPLRPLALRLEVQTSGTRRTFAGGFRQNRDIRRNGGSLEISYRVGSAWEVGGELEVLAARDRVPTPETTVKLFRFAPRVTVAFRGKGRLRLETRLAKLNAEPAGRAIPYEMANGLEPGFSAEWRARFEYRLSNGLMASVSYVGRSDPFRPRTVHRMQAEVRAYF